MKNVKNLKKWMLYLGVLFLLIGLSSCSDDDDGDVVVEPTGSFAVGEEFSLTGNTLTIESVTVGQNSWLVAVNPGDENTNNFISDPVMLEEGTNTNVMLTLDETAITDDGTGQQIVLKLYADNATSGTVGEWDSSDEPIMDGNTLVTETVTIFAEDDTAFADFDTNNDGSLDMDEVPATYQNNFTEWDTDDSGSLSSEEFYNTVFGNTDADDDDLISEDEWNLGYDGLFGNWSDDDFATFDADDSGFLDIDEWNNNFADSQWFEEYDADDDTFVTEDEWDTGLFGDWDADDNELINEAEFDLYSPYVVGW